MLFGCLLYCFVISPNLQRVMRVTISDNIINIDLSNCVKFTQTLKPNTNFQLNAECERQDNSIGQPLTVRYKFAFNVASRRINSVHSLFLSVRHSHLQHTTNAVWDAVASVQTFTMNQTNQANRLSACWHIRYSIATTHWFLFQIHTHVSRHIDEQITNECVQSTHSTKFCASHTHTQLPHKHHSLAQMRVICVGYMFNNFRRTKCCAMPIIYSYSWKRNFRKKYSKYFSSFAFKCKQNPS